MTAILISFTNQNYSRTSVYLDAYTENNAKMKFIKLPANFRKYSVEVWKLRNVLRDRNNKVVVMSPCHILVPIIKIITGRSVYIDAGWPLSDATAGNTHRVTFLLKYLKNLMIDFLAFQISSRIMLESNAQVNHVSKKFLINKKKLRVLFTGLNEKRFDSTNPNLDDTILKKLGINYKNGYVFFRGKNVKESGLVNIMALVDKVNENMKFVIATNSPLPLPKKVHNVIIITKKLTDNEIAALYRKSIINLGQMSNSKRLNLTIPHKAFESGYFGKTYLAISKDGIRELYDENIQILYIEKFSIFEVIRKLNEISVDKKKRTSYESSIKERYSKVASQIFLQNQFLKAIEE